VHEARTAEMSYKQFLPGSRVGAEATGNCPWFLELVSRLGQKLWVRDAFRSW
jgi:hypothetical protein